MTQPTQNLETSLNFDDLVEELRRLMGQLPDKRTGRNTHYSMEDVAAAAFSVFFTQSASFLAHQTLLAKATGNSNAQSLFGVRVIPSDNHIRDLLDPVPPQTIFPMFDRVFFALQEQGQLEVFRVLDGQLLVALDGTEYHRSKTIHCPQCTVIQHRQGTPDYAHAVVTPVIVSPNHSRVFPLAPAFITPQDGHQKQDCELAAAKRWIREVSSRYRQKGPITLLGDDLYSRQPLCEAALDAGLNVLFVCKPSSHRTLYEWLEGPAAQTVDSLSVERRKGKKRETDTYRFAQALPLRDGEDALRVNWCELTSTDSDGNTLYHNAFISNLPIHADNAVALIAAARARWKVENESNNTLKTKGYHLTHNFGHGKKHLSTLLVTLNLLAFLMHTVLDLMDARYRLIREELPTRKLFFQHIQALTTYIIFDSYIAMLDFMMKGLEIEIPDTG